MKLLYPIVLLLACTKNAAALYVTTSPTSVTSTLPLLTRTRLHQQQQQPTSTIREEPTVSSSVEHSSVITLAPLTVNPMMERSEQRCFNDQGFSVDCATWTGYYYSWGPAEDPYRGGPGDVQDGSGSGNSGGSGSSGLVYQSGSSFFNPDPALAAMLGFCLLMAALLLE